MATLTLNRNRHRCLEGHCWVFRSEIASLDVTPAAGDLVTVVDGRQRVVGFGLWSPASQIAVRLLAHHAVTLDAAFWRERLRQAISYRDRICDPAQTCRRLVHSEADLLPGLILDRYHDRYVMQITTASMEAHREALIAAITAACTPAALIERSDMSVRVKEGLPPRTCVLIGDATRRAERIGRALIPVDPLDPHKTGGYLDQQDNYQHVAGWVEPGAQVLDVFCHLGGFALHAALRGAARVIAIDSAEASCAGAQEAAALNQVSDRIEVRCANAFDALRELASAGPHIDVAILDPPAFARSREQVAGALRGYKDLHLRALQTLKVGGVLATFSCSHHVDAETYAANVVAAAQDARVVLRRESVVGASRDHPVLAAVPETEYLKGAVYRIIDRW